MLELYKNPHIFRAMIWYPISNDEKPAYVSTDQHTTLRAGLCEVPNIDRTLIACEGPGDSAESCLALHMPLSPAECHAANVTFSCKLSYLTMHPTIKMRCEKGYFYYRLLTCKILCF